MIKVDRIITIAAINHHTDIKSFEGIVIFQIDIVIPAPGVDSKHRIGAAQRIQLEVGTL